MFYSHAFLYEVVNGVVCLFVVCFSWFFFGLFLYPLFYHKEKSFCLAIYKAFG